LKVSPIVVINALPNVQLTKPLLRIALSRRKRFMRMPIGKKSSELILILTRFCFGCKPKDKPLGINVKACTVRICAMKKVMSVVLNVTV